MASPFARGCSSLCLRVGGLVFLTPVSACKLACVNVVLSYGMSGNAVSRPGTSAPYKRCVALPDAQRRPAGSLCSNIRCMLR